jgi:hypothetical protein
MVLRMPGRIYDKLKITSGQVNTKRWLDPIDELASPGYRTPSSNEEGVLP